MCGSLISYPTEQFSKLIFVTKILLHRPYKACENSNTDIEGLSSHLWKIKTLYFVFWVEYRRENRFPRAGVFVAARDENIFRPVAVLFRKKKTNPRKDGRTNIRDVYASWKKVKCLYLYSTDTAFTQHKHDKYSLQTKGQMPADKRFSKGTWNSKLTHGEFVARVIVLRFLLVKKIIDVNQDRTCALSWQWPFNQPLDKWPWSPAFRLNWIYYYSNSEPTDKPRTSWSKCVKRLSSI